MVMLTRTASLSLGDWVCENAMTDPETIAVKVTADLKRFGIIEEPRWNAHGRTSNSESKEESAKRKEVRIILLTPGTEGG
jgi:hypothetical protein